MHHAGLLPPVVKRVQYNLQVQSSLAKAVTVDNEVAANFRTLHTLNVSSILAYLIEETTDHDLTFCNLGAKRTALLGNALQNTTECQR